MSRGGRSHRGILVELVVRSKDERVGALRPARSVIGDAGRESQRVTAGLVLVGDGLTVLESAERVARGYAAMTMVGVLAQADIGGEEQLGEELGEEFQSLYDGSDIGVGVGTAFVLWTKIMRPSVLGVPEVDQRLPTFSSSTGTPNRMTLLKPFSTNGFRKPSSLLIPHRFCPGNDLISISASGSSVMKMGYMSMSLLKVRPRDW